jgi:hypothetical protein
MTELIDVSLKKIIDTESLLLLRDKIHLKMAELKRTENENDNIFILLKKKYFNISNKITYINNRDVIIERNRERNREYIKENYSRIKECNRLYQQHRREHYKDINDMVEILKNYGLINVSEHTGHLSILREHL